MALRLTPDQAVPLALLASEAITNAIKYSAGENGGRARLKVTLRTVGTDAAELAVINSVSPDAAQLDEPGAERTGLGSQLVESFAMQLGGVLDRQVSDREYRLALVLHGQSADRRRGAADRRTGRRRTVARVGNAPRAKRFPNIKQ